MRKPRQIFLQTLLFLRATSHLRLSTHLFFRMPDQELDNFIPLRTRCTARLFRKLDESKATGEDKISAAILKRLSDCLAMPFTQVCRRLLYEGCWPRVWKTHLIVPIYKKGSAFNPGNYRGVHLTSILSKLAEKIIGHRLVPFLQRNAFGDNQWAFSTGLGASDLVTMLVMSWILGICTDKKLERASATFLGPSIAYSRSICLQSYTLKALAPSI